MTLSVGSVVTLECQGDAPNPVGKFLDGDTVRRTVGLAPETGGVFTGTRWTVHQNGSTFQFECEGQELGPRILDGNTINGTVSLVTDMGLSGTRWQVLIN
jgi:hypothetical protein